MNYKEFRVGDLFDLINNPQLDRGHFQFENSAEYPYFTRTENNNGILGYVNYLDEKHKIRGNSLAVGMISMCFHYMSHDFYAGQFTKTAIPKFNEFNEKVAMYFITELNKRSEYYKGFLVKDFANEFSNTKLLLPTSNGNNPDYVFMERFIDNFEQEKVKKLKQYLAEAGLDDYNLTDEDKEIWKRKVDYKQFCIKDLFYKLKAPYTGKKKKQDSVSKVQTEEFNIPLINCKWGNNGIMYYGRESEFIHYENVLSVIYNGPPTVGTVYAQPKIGVYTDAYLIALKKDIMPEMTIQLCLYLKTAVEKSIHGTKYSRSNKATWENKVENDFICLPVKLDGTPDYEYMDKYIRVQEKLIIKNILLGENTIT